VKLASHFVVMVTGFPWLL